MNPAPSTLNKLPEPSDKEHQEVAAVAKVLDREQSGGKHQKPKKVEQMKKDVEIVIQ